LAFGLNRRALVYNPLQVSGASPPLRRGSIIGDLAATDTKDDAVDKGQGMTARVDHDRMDRPTGRAMAARVLAAGLMLVMALVTLSACAPQMRYHGFAPADEELAQIQVGRDSRAEVVERLGRPGMGGVLEGSGIFYVQSDWRHEHWRSPVEVDRQVVAISFDGRDRVSNIERFGLRDGEIVALSRRVTDMGSQPGVLSQVLRVFGQFAPGAFIGASER
jgi:outer membrane protein assembly factor BamE (lipoprotein component of BamABCDE complex)